jgi:hypothetical protein
MKYNDLLVFLGLLDRFFDHTSMLEGNVSLQFMIGLEHLDYSICKVVLEVKEFYIYHSLYFQHYNYDERNHDPLHKDRYHSHLKQESRIQ